ncbi:HEAT repeat domain-containing protein [Egbenema bharatensis]|uniref:HEAT repeat domain-containing protein n=1 Tax=Egbenema bharatensis TaxID=3463334 RepID=UPI003A873B96
MDTPISDAPNLDEILKQIQETTIPATVLPLISVLAQHSTEGIPALLELLQHHHPAIVSAVATQLEQLAPTSVEPLIAGFHTCTDQLVQAQIVCILARIADPQALDLLVEVVGVEVANHCQGNVRRVAARGLGPMVNATTVSGLRQRAIERLTWALLHAEDWALRYAAALSLAEIATSEAQMTLHQALKQEADPVVKARIQAIVQPAEAA